MPSYKDPLEKTTFDYRTTYLTDYRGHQITAPIYTKYKPKPQKPREEYKPLKYVETMDIWKTKPVSFTMYHKPKDVVRENPRVVQKKIENQTDDEEKEKVMKTRPRLVMTPALSLDDMPDPKTREDLVKDIYTSSYMRANNDIPRNYFTVKAPLGEHPAPANPVFLEKPKLSVVPEEWRMETVSWDGKQIRGYWEPTKAFWLNYKVPTCNACEQTKIVVADRLQKTKAIQQRKR